jgi:hypothetical protein
MDMNKMIELTESLFKEQIYNIHEKDFISYTFILEKNPDWYLEHFTNEYIMLYIYLHKFAKFEIIEKTNNLIKMLGDNINTKIICI